MCFPPVDFKAVKAGSGYGIHVTVQFHDRNLVVSCLVEMPWGQKSKWEAFRQRCESLLRLQSPSLPAVYVYNRIQFSVILLGSRKALVGFLETVLAES